MFDGQSLIYAPYHGSAWPDKFMRDNSNYAAESFRVAIAGTSFAQRTTTASTRVDPLLTPTDRRVVLISDGGESDIMANLTPAQCVSAMKSYNDSRRAAGADYIVMPTLTPGVIGWYTAPQLANIPILNSLLLADPAAAGLDRVIDVASIPELTNASDTTYYYDGIHYTSAATTLVAQKWIDSEI